MNYGDVKHNLWGNVVSNYVRAFLGTLVGLASFRLIYQGFTREQFGFWSLLWSVFGYGVLLDFGFGFAAQKRVAELSVSKEWGLLSKVLSTILFFYCGMASIIVIVVLCTSTLILHWFHITGENFESFRRVLIVFFLCIGLAFPMGIFPEILRGQQRICLANTIISICMVVRLCFTCVAIWFNWGFMVVALISLLFSLFPDVIAAIYAMRFIPQVRLSYRLFSKGMISETLQFSFFAYLTTATNIVLNKTHQLVLGSVLSVSAVALYQAASKVAETFAVFTRQLQDTLSPAAAHLHASGDKESLRDLMIQSTRWSIIIATPVYLLCAFYLVGLLRLLTGDRIVPTETVLVGHGLLFWFYISLITHSVSKRIFIMCGHERRLMWLGLGECIANLILNVVLVYVFKHVFWVVVGSLVPGLYVGWFHLWPWVAKDVGIKGWNLFKLTILPTWLSCLPMFFCLLVLKFPCLLITDYFVSMIFGGIVGGIVGGVGMWRWAILQNERNMLVKKVMQLVGKFKSLCAIPV